MKELEDKMMAIVKDNDETIKKAKERVEKFVDDVLGDEWRVFYFTHSGFSVRMVRNEQQVFGCEFDIRIDQNWHYNEEHEFVYTPKVEASIGTCGSFEISLNDDHMWKYLAFARFLKQFQRYGEKEKFLRDYKKVEKNYEEYRKLDAELTGRKEQ